MKIIQEAMEVHDELNPKLWNPDGTLKTDVANKINEIVNQFIEYLEEDGIKIELVDTHLLGSNASYNYTSESDLDVHLVVNFELMDAPSELIQVLFNSERASFNSTYDISLHGVEVELFVEDIKATTISNGIYSMNKGDWIKYPEPIEVPELDIDSDVDEYKERIDEVLKSENSEEVKSMINELYLLRKDSLDTGGEYSEGNQIFKEIRSEGLLEDLKERLNELISDELSLENLRKES